MPAPTKYPDWATNGGGTVVEPPAGKVAAGWVPSEQPPSGWFNWWQALVGQWVRWLEARANGVDTALARAAFKDAANTFMQQQTIAAPAGTGLHVTGDVAIDGILATSRLSVEGAHEATFAQDVAIAGVLEVTGDITGLDDMLVAGSLRAGNDVRAVNDFEYVTPKARSTIVPIAAACPWSGGLVKVDGIGGGLKFTAVAQVVSFPIKPPAGSELASVQVMYDKPTAVGTGLYLYRYHTITWTPTPVVPTTVELAHVTHTTTGLAVVTLTPTPALTTQVDGTEDYEVVVVSGAANEVIRAVRINWTDHGPRNH